MKIINSNDLGFFYKLVNKNTYHKTGIGPLKMPNGGLALDDVKKAKILNDFFVGMCTVDNGVCPNEPDKGPDKKCLDTVSFTVTATYTLLKRIKKKTHQALKAFPQSCLTSWRLNSPAHYP